MKRFITTILLTFATVLIGTGCVTNGRRVLLKEYGPSVSLTESNPLKGVTVCLKGFESAADLVSLKLNSKPEELKGFHYTDFTREQDQQWDKEQRAAQQQKDKREIEIGNMRDGFGIVMSHVYALNDPAQWLAEGLKYDLEAQGAKVVDSSHATDADAVVDGKLQLCRVDMYMTVDASIVVDLTVQPKTGAARQCQIHTHGMTVAVLASEGEYFHALRDARQKFSILVAREIAEAVRVQTSALNQK
jgi:hypothetical protein